MLSSSVMDDIWRQTAGAAQCAAGAPVTAVQRWLTEKFPDIQRRARREGAQIFFADEAGVRFGLSQRHDLGKTRTDTGRVEHWRTFWHQSHLGGNLTKSHSPASVLVT